DALPIYEGGLGGGIHVLHDEEIEFVAERGEAGAVDPGVGGVGGDDPEALDFAGVDGVDDLVVGKGAFRGDVGGGDAEDVGDLGAVRWVGEIASAEERGGVGVEARAHGVALAGDGVGPGAGAAEVAGNEREVDEGLRGAGGFVDLVDAHGPLEEDGFASRDDLGEVAYGLGGYAGDGLGG